MDISTSYKTLNELLTAQGVLDGLCEVTKVTKVGEFPSADASLVISQRLTKKFVAPTDTYDRQSHIMTA